LCQKNRDVFYFQNKNECDFVVKEKDKITHAVQVCWDFNEENKNREINGLLAALRDFSLREGLILTYNQNDKFVIEGKKVIVKPVWEWLAE